MSQNTDDLKRLYYEWKTMKPHTMVSEYMNAPALTIDPSRAITAGLFSEYLFLKNISKCPICYSENLSIPSENLDLCSTSGMYLGSGTVVSSHYLSEYESGIHPKSFISYYSLDCLECAHRAFFPKSIVEKNIEKMLGIDSDEQ